MTSLSRLTIQLAIAAAAAALIPGGGAQAQYYKDKTIEMILPVGAGGGMTRTARQFNRFFEKHIAGNPTIVIKNVPGGGGNRGTNLVYQRGNKDGTTLYWGVMNFAGIVAGMPGIKYDPEKFEIIGALTTNYISIIRTDVGGKLQKPADIVDKSDFVVAGRAIGTGLDMYSIMPLDILGVKHRYVSGYRAQPKMKAAMMSNEAQMITTGNPGFWAFYVNDNIKKGEAITLFYHSRIDLETGKPEDYGTLYGKDVKDFVSFYREVKGKDPSGPAWEAYKWYSSYQAVPFWIALPPGVPDEAVAALRAGFDATAADKDMLAAFQKSDHGVVRYLPGAEAEKIARNFRKVSPEAVAYLRKVMQVETIKKSMGKK